MTSTESFFEALKTHRESQNIEISEICDFTKINTKYIQAIESGDFKILPVVYMRLFLRAYATFIGADSDQVLKDYELYTTGKINQSTMFDIKQKESASSDLELQDTKPDALSQIAPKQIIIGIAIIVGLFLILYWAGEITKQQVNEIEMSPKTEVPQINTQSSANSDLIPDNALPDNNSDSNPIQAELKKETPKFVSN